MQHLHRTHDLRSGSQDRHPSKNSAQKTICCNSTSDGPDDGRMYPKHVELRIRYITLLHQVGISNYFSTVKSELQLLGLKIMTFSVMVPGGPDRTSNRGPPQCKSRTLLLDPIRPAWFHIATERPFSICLASFNGDRTR